MPSLNPNLPHQVALEPSECPGYFFILCKCGWWKRTYQGLSAAEEIAQRHLFMVGAFPKINGGK